MNEHKADTAFWNEYFRSYDILNIVHAYRDLLSSVMLEMNLQSGMKVLDAGAGTGNLAVLIAKTGAEVYGLDSSDVGLQIFKEKVPNGKTVIHDLKNEIPLQDIFFDYVCCVNTLFALPKIQRELVCKELHRVLKPGGKIIMTNLLEGYKPINIYSHHIAQEIKRIGVLRTIVHVVSILKPTLKMFYYSRQMRKKDASSGNVQFFKLSEQENLLKNAGFSKISTGKKLFANQAILNTAYKV